MFPGMPEQYEEAKPLSFMPFSSASIYIVRIGSMGKNICNVSGGPGSRIEWRPASRSHRDSIALGQHAQSS